jgi:hypothetical protein
MQGGRHPASAVARPGARREDGETAAFSKFARIPAAAPSPVPPVTSADLDKVAGTYVDSHERVRLGRRHAGWQRFIAYDSALRPISNSLRDEADGRHGGQLLRHRAGRSVRRAGVSRTGRETALSLFAYLRRVRASGASGDAGAGDGGSDDGGAPQSHRRGLRFDRARLAQILATMPRSPLLTPPRVTAVRHKE